MVKIVFENFAGPKMTPFFGCKTRSFLERLQQRNSTVPKLFNSRVNIQPIYAPEEIVGPCSRKFLQRPIFVPNTDSMKVQGLDCEIKLAHKLAVVVDRPNINIYLTLLRHRVEVPEAIFAQVLLFPRKKEDKKFKKLLMRNKNVRNLSIYLK